MPIRSWKENQNWEKLDNINIGDKVRLEYINTFEYCAEVLVNSIENNHISGTVLTIFDAQTSGTITGGEELNLINTAVTIDKKYIHGIIQR